VPYHSSYDCPRHCNKQPQDKFCSAAEFLLHLCHFEINFLFSFDRSQVLSASEGNEKSIYLSELFLMLHFPSRDGKLAQMLNAVFAKYKDCTVLS